MTLSNEQLTLVHYLPSGLMHFTLLQMENTLKWLLVETEGEGQFANR